MTSNLYGTKLDNNQPCFIYERPDTSALAYVNHVVHEKLDDMYMPLGSYVGPDCDYVLKNRERRLRSAKGHLVFKPKATSTLPRSVRR